MSERRARQAIVVRRETAETMRDARKIAHSLAKETGDKIVRPGRSTKNTHRYRLRDTREFRPGTFKTEKVGDGVNVVTGALRPEYRRSP